jgi:hypothetical protein
MAGLCDFPHTLHTPLTERPEDKFEYDAGLVFRSDFPKVVPYSVTESTRQPSAIELSILAHAIMQYQKAPRKIGDFSNRRVILISHSQWFSYHIG